MKRLFIFCILLISTSIIAEPSQTYLDFNINYGGLQTKNSDYTPPFYYNPKTSHQIGGLGFGINAGYLFDSYQISLPYQWRLGAEAGYNQFADNTYTYKASYSSNDPDETKYSSYALTFLGVLHYQNETGWLAFFKAGVAKVIQNLKASSFSSDNSISKADFAPQLSLGGGYQLTQSVNVKISYNYIMGKTPETGANNSVAPVSYLAFNLGYSF